MKKLAATTSGVAPKAAVLFGVVLSLASCGNGSTVAGSGAAGGVTDDATASSNVPTVKVNGTKGTLGYPAECTQLDNELRISMDVGSVDPSQMPDPGSSEAASGTYQIEAWSNGKADVFFNFDGQNVFDMTNMGEGGPSHVVTGKTHTFTGKNFELTVTCP